MKKRNKDRVFGDQMEFAIKLSSYEPRWKIGKIQFWIKGICLGKDEETYIKPNLLALSRVNDLSSYPILDPQTNPLKTIFQNIFESEELYSLTLLGLGETFDEYILRMYMYETNIVAIWMVMPIEKKSKKMSYSNVQGASVKSKDFFRVLDKCNKKL